MLESKLRRRDEDVKHREEKDGFNRKIRKGCTNSNGRRGRQEGRKEGMRVGSKKGCGRMEERKDAPREVPQGPSS